MIIQLVEHRAWNMELLYHRVHDMVLDLIVSKSAEENFLGVVENLETITRRQQCKTRRLSLQLDEAELGKIAPCMSLPHVRSLFIFGLPHRSIGLLELKFLHVLFVCKVDGLDLTLIGKLSQLRYLYVKSYHRSSMQLPRQICGLHHLETLVTDGQLSHLPHDIVHLSALSYLKVFVSIAYHDGISKMKSLHTLDCFDPSKQSLDNLMALGELLNLRELHFCITDYNFPTMETH
jgi:disease resistance protein RPM1